MPDGCYHLLAAYQRAVNAHMLRVHCAVPHQFHQAIPAAMPAVLQELPT